MKINRETIISASEFFTLLTISFVGSTKYRHFIYSNNLYDYHIADTLPNLLCVPVSYSLGTFLSKLFEKPLANRYLPILYCAIGFLFYELLELPTGGFDWLDCLAIVIGSAITVLAVIVTKKEFH